jgi:hypothetical protein
MGGAQSWGWCVCRHVKNLVLRLREVGEGGRPFSHEIGRWKNKRVLHRLQRLSATTTVLSFRQATLRLCVCGDPPHSSANGNDAARTRRLRFLIRPWNVPKVPRSSPRLSSTFPWDEIARENGGHQKLQLDVDGRPSRSLCYPATYKVVSNCG